MVLDELAKHAARLNQSYTRVVADPGSLRELIKRHAKYRERNAEIPGGPGGVVEPVADFTRLVVAARLCTLSSQVREVTGWLNSLGASVDAVEDDDRIGVSLLTVSGIATQNLYEAVLALSRRDPSGTPPLCVGLDDVTVQAAHPRKIIYKPVSGQSGAGSAVRYRHAAKRPDGTGLGAGVTVAVIDGGYESERVPDRTDGWFDNVKVPSDPRPGLDLEKPGQLDPGAGHGTFVTGALVGHAPDVNVRQYVATDSFGFGSAWRLKDCLLQAAEDGCHIINVSLGFTDPDLIGSPAISAALHSLPSDIIVVAAAGNCGSTTPMLPAAHTVSVAVGGLDADLAPLGWSNRGAWVDFSAVANPVLSTYVQDPAAPNADPNPWAVWAGTSFAAPKVAGLLAVQRGQGLDVIDCLRQVRAMAVSTHPDFGYLLDLKE